MPWHGHDYTSHGLADALKHAEGIPDLCISAVAAAPRLVANMFHALLTRGFARGPLRLPAAKSSNGRRTLRASSRRVSGALRPRLLRRRWAGVKAQGGGFGIDITLRCKIPQTDRGHGARKIALHRSLTRRSRPPRTCHAAEYLGAVRTLAWLCRLTQFYPTRNRSGES
jgi:hypothetical protein